MKLYDIANRRWTRIASGTSISAPVWSADSKFLYFQDLLAPGQLLSRYSLRHPAIEPVFDFSPLLKTVATRCAFLGFAADGSLRVRISVKGSNLYKLELELP